MRATAVGWTIRYTALEPHNGNIRMLFACFALAIYTKLLEAKSSYPAERHSQVRRVLEMIEILSV